MEGVVTKTGKSEDMKQEEEEEEWLVIEMREGRRKPLSNLFSIH